MNDILENSIGQSKIISEIENILVHKVKVNPRLVCPQNYDEPFTGTVFRLQGRDVLYIFLEVEKYFGITIDVNQILNYEFNTMNGIKQLIRSVS